MSGTPPLSLGVPAAASATLSSGAGVRTSPRERPIDRYASSLEAHPDASVAASGTASPPLLSTSVSGHPKPLMIDGRAAQVRDLHPDDETPPPYYMAMLWRAMQKTYTVVVKDLVITGSIHIYASILLTFYGIRTVALWFPKIPVEPYDAATSVGIASTVYFIVDRLFDKMIEKGEVSTTWRKGLLWGKTFFLTMACGKIFGLKTSLEHGFALWVLTFGIFYKSIASFKKPVHGPEKPKGQ
jgi:hypothetical protein